MAHAVEAHPVHWHVNVQQVGNEIALYNARLRKNQAGWGARDSLHGDGFRNENRSRFVPFEPESEADAKRYWKSQQRDPCGHTQVAKAIENTYAREWQRSSTPAHGAYLKRSMISNVQRIRQASESVRRARTPSSFAHSTEPLADRDLMAMCRGVVAEKKQVQVQKWLSTASLAEKDSFRKLLTNLRRHDSRHRHVRADILDLSKDETRPTTAASALDERFGGGSQVLRHREPLERKLHGKLRGYNNELARMFSFEDPDQIGQISMEAFTDVLKSYHVLLTNEEADLVRVLFENEGGMILYLEFLKVMLPRTAASDHADKLRNSLPPKALDQFTGGGLDFLTTEDIIALLRTKIQQLGGQNALQTTFRKFDLDGNGTVDIGEMLEVLHNFGIFVSTSQVEKMMNVFDPDGSGAINYLEFVHKVLPPDITEDEKGAMVFGMGLPPKEQPERTKPAPPGKYRQRFFVPRKSSIRPNYAIDVVSLVEGLRQLLKDHVLQRFGSTRRAFKAMLKHQPPGQQSSNSCASQVSPRVSIFGFRSFLKAFMIATTAKESQALFDYIDRDKDGWLDFNDLVDSLGPLSKDMTYVESAKVAASPGSAQLGNLKTTQLRPPSSASARLRPHTPDMMSKVLGMPSRVNGGEANNARPRTSTFFLSRPER